MSEQLAHIDSWRAKQSQLQLAVLGIAVAATALVVALLVAGNRGATTIPAVNGGPKLVTQAQLEEFAGTLDHPLYWAGPKEGYSLELTRTSGGKIFLRYLPKGVPAGDSRPEFLTVGTYAGPKAFADLKRVWGREGSVSLSLPHDGLVVYEAATPTNVYFGYPDAAYQVEVYSPSAKTARSLVLDGRVTPVG
jgi:hypothetical protein